MNDGLHKVCRSLSLSEPHRKSLGSISRSLESMGHEVFLVGGCVRDLLLGREPKDYDLCTSATPDEVKSILSMGGACGRYSFIDTGLRHGTVTVHDKDENTFYEITTYRVDGNYEDHIQKSKIYPQKTLSFFTTIATELSKNQNS